MSGTKLGGLHARDTNLARYGKDYYRRMGKIGGKAKGTGFNSSEEASRAGKLGAQKRWGKYAKS